MTENSDYVTMFASIGKRQDVLKPWKEPTMPHNFFRQLNEDILEFSNSPENRTLINRTWSYSTLFRGGLFGKEDEEAVLVKLENRCPDILLLGSNPNAGDHTEAGKAKQYRTLRSHIELGKLGEQNWTEKGATEPGWSPFNTNTLGWRILTTILTTATGTHCDNIGFANFVPWGSQSWKKFPEAIGDDQLLARILNFSDKLNSRVIEKLKPKVLIVPFSLVGIRSRNKLDKITFVKDHRHATHHSFQAGNRTFNYSVGQIDRNGFKTTAVYMPHPSSFRFTDQAKTSITEKLGGAIKKILKNDHL